MKAPTLYNEFELSGGSLPGSDIQDHIRSLIKNIQ